MTVLSAPLTVCCVPPLSANRDGTFGLLIGMRPVDFTREALAGLVEVAQRLLAERRERHGWLVMACARCGVERPCRPRGRFPGHCAGCVSHLSQFGG